MFRSKIFKFVEEKFDILETVFILILLASSIVMMNEITFALYGIWGSLTLLALLYFLMSLRPFEEKVAGLRIVIRRVVYITYALGCLTVLSVFQFDGDINSHRLIIATLCFIGVSVVALLLLRYKMNVKKQVFGLLLRCGIFAAVLAWLLTMY
ncbi:MAG: hypothetical protein IKP73_09495 [Bacteroidales bacterium]|jgi:membrane-bound metal-dependent hydrolase YbcI (DUF457 family)|nr:hypothetical protein [Bacteroidales bacterium]MBR4325744.1 hypothetical protein [Bacteroidales bacterium]